MRLTHRRSATRFGFLTRRTARMLTREFVGSTIGQNWHYVFHDRKAVPFCWHYHPEFELTFTNGAQGTRYVGSDVAAFDALDLVLVAPNQAHTWHSCTQRDDTRIQVVFFTQDWLRTLADGGLPEFAAFIEWLRTVREGVVFSPACIHQLLPAFERLHAQRDLARLAALLSILEALPRDTAARPIGALPGGMAGNPPASPQGELPGAHGNDQRLDAALAFLHAHYLQPITLEALADAAATSPSTLKRLFRAHLGRGLSALLIQLRVGHACHLLVSTECPVGLVASASGFANPGHFFALFRRLHGMPPAEFRRRYRLRSETRHAG